MNRNPEVDHWLDAADHPLDATLRRARDIILAADSRVSDPAPRWTTFQPAPTDQYSGGAHNAWFSSIPGVSRA